MPTPLTTLELHVLLAVRNLHRDGYGISIMQHILDRTGRALAPGVAYNCITVLEAKGYVRTRLGEVTPERGGRRKTHVVLTRSGERAIQESLRAIDALRIP